MVRAWDESYGFAGRFYARKEHAPVVVDGRQPPRLGGCRRRARLDVPLGGERVCGARLRRGRLPGSRRQEPHGRRDPPRRDGLHARWTALGAPVALHAAPRPRQPHAVDGGRGRRGHHRRLSLLGEAPSPARAVLLQPGSEETYAGGPTIVRPLTAEKDLARRLPLHARRGVARGADPRRDGASATWRCRRGPRWYDWWAPGTDRSGRRTDAPRLRATSASVHYPLFVRSGAIVPVAVDDDPATGSATAASAGKLTVLVYPDAEKTQLSCCTTTDDVKTTIEAVEKGAGFSVSLSRTLRATRLRIRVEQKPSSVSVDGKAASEVGSLGALGSSEAGYFHDAATRSLWVELPLAAGARTISVP
jgi:hypothetical protein